MKNNSLRLFIISVLMLLCLSVQAENYFRAGTVWTVMVDGYFGNQVPEDRIFYQTILDEITFEGEQVLPFVQYSEENPEPELLRYLRTDGDKVYWRSIDPEYPNWYLLYDFGLEIGDEVVIYNLQRKRDEEGKPVEIIYPATLKCLQRDFYSNNNLSDGPLMRLQMLTYRDNDYSSYDDTKGNWIIGMGYTGGPGDILTPFLWGWDGGGTSTLCVESPKGNVVYGDPKAGIENILNSSLSSQNGVYNLQGIRVANTTENLPQGMYIVGGKKVLIR